MFEKYLIVSDMDGTFFGQKAAVLPRNVNRIKEFISNGGAFTFATGRDAPALTIAYPKAYEVASVPAILCNGTYLYDFQTKTLTHETKVDQEALTDLIQTIRDRFPSVGYRISTEQGFISDYYSPFIADRLKNYTGIMMEGPLSSFSHLSWHKLCFNAPADETKNLTDYLFSILDQYPMFDVTTSSDTLSEILPKGVNKGSALSHLRKMFPDRTIVGVGDFNNDLEILTQVDIPASPANALDEVKAISKLHLCHHAEGCIADLIDQLYISTND